MIELVYLHNEGLTRHVASQRPSESRSNALARLTRRLCNGLEAMAKAGDAFQDIPLVIELTETTLNQTTGKPLARVLCTFTVSEELAQRAPKESKS